MFRLILLITLWVTTVQVYAFSPPVIQAITAEVSYNPVVGYGISFGTPTENLLHREKLKTLLGDTYRGFDAQSNRFVVAMRADDPSPVYLKEKVQAHFPKAQFVEINYKEYQSVYPRLK